MQKEEPNNFYQALGQLFYAVAAVDKTIDQKEINQLQKSVLSEWHQYDEEAAFLIEVVFDELVQQQKDAYECLDEFKAFKESNKNLFTEKVNNRIWTTVNAIANSKAGTNKSELVFMSKLDTILK